MDTGGVGTARIAVAWHDVEPSPGVYAWGALDRAALDAARHGIRLLPFVAGTPLWISDDAAKPPIFTAEQRQGWAVFLRLLVERYGPGGTLWEGVDDPLPIRVWQIWNEPNFPRFYQPEPSPRGYGRLVKLSASAIRSADPDVRVMLAGVAPVISGPRPDRYLDELYDVPGIRRHFDVAALHPYARGIGRLRIQVKRVRDVMRRAGDRRTPLEITEMGWASRKSAGHDDGGATRGLRGQAQMVTRAYSVLEKNRQRWRLRAAHWFAWQDSPEPELLCSFCQFSGLLTDDRRAKPAWRAYKRATGSR